MEMQRLSLGDMRRNILEREVFGDKIEITEELKKEYEKEHLSYDHKREQYGKNIESRLPYLAEAVKRGNNANEKVGYALLLKEFAEREMWRNVVIEVFSQNKYAWRELKRHKEGDVYIHKLPDSAIVPYCIGHDYGKVLKKGIVNLGYLTSKPAKHLHTAINHAKNFLLASQLYFTGAQAFSSLELWWAPFYAKDGLDYESMKRLIESFYYEMNHPWRPGMQSVFSNNTVTIISSNEMMEEKVIIGGKQLNERLKDYLDYGLEILRAIFEVEKEGDATGSPFTYPIQNVMMTKELMKEIESYPELFEAFYGAAGEKGAQYFENAVVGTKNKLGEDSFMDPNEVRAMCCRALWKKVSDVKARAIFGIGDETGSKGVVTINLPRIALRANGDYDKFFQLLEEEMSKTAEFLAWWHGWYMWVRYYGMPEVFDFINYYQPYETFEVYWLTFGAVGMVEAALILADEEYTVWKSSDFTALRKLVKDYEKPMIKFMAEKAIELGKKYKAKYGIMSKDFDFFNVEEVPAETAASKLLLKDIKKFGKERLQKYVNFEAGMYTNTIVPYWAEIPITLVAELEGYVQRDFTGGVMHHFRFSSPIEDPDKVAKIVKMILNYGVINFSITPRVCNAKGECFERIVGWMVRIKEDFNDFRKREFSTRIHYDVENGKIVRYDPFTHKAIEVKEPEFDPFKGLF